MKRIGYYSAVVGAAILCAVQLRLTAAAADTDGWQTVNGRRYYYQNGEAVTGTVEIDGELYLFAPNGAQQIGWQTVNGNRYYYDRDGSPLFGWVHWFGEEYYVTRENGKLTGEQIPEDVLVNFDEYGILQHGWLTDENGDWYFVDSVGQTAVGEFALDGVSYLTDETGVLLTGWQTPSDGITRYYGAETHTVLTGWLTLGGEQYYADPESGRLSGIWTLSDGITHYFDADGIRRTGLIEIDGATYLFEETDGMYTGLYNKFGNVRYFDDDGIMQTGFLTLEDGTHYFNEEGLAQRGITAIDGDNYYFDNSTLMMTGWVQLGNISYYFNADGKGAVGWQEVDGKTRYFDTNSILRTGAVKINDTVYILDAEGCLVSGWCTVGDKTYYADEDGIAATGWQEIGDYGYYFGENGVMAVSTTVEEFTIDAEGHAKSPLAVTVDKLLQNTQYTPMSIYSLVVSNYRYAYIEATRSYAQLHAAGWDSLIRYTLTNRRGVCYYLAATMDYFLQRAGYTTRLVHATHNTGNHYWNQVLVNGVWQNYDPTYSNRGNLAWNTQIALGNYIVLGYVQVLYDKRGAYLGDIYT